MTSHLLLEMKFIDMRPAHYVTLTALARNIQKVTHPPSIWPLSVTDGDGVNRFTDDENEAEYVSGILRYVAGA